MRRSCSRSTFGARPRRLGAGSVAFMLLLLATSCRRVPEPLVLASTTSTEDSGLFDVLVPAFERAHADQKIQLIAVGTGQALELGRRGDADVLLVHAPAAEQTFMAEGRGELRWPVMYNDFVVVGPASDPAHIRGLPLADALRALATSHTPFISRGDDSGTHKKEQSLWQAAGVRPAGEWYSDVGQGMGETLAIAGERQAYTLSDRATFLALQQRGTLSVLVAGDAALFNPYSVIVVRGARNQRGARAFAEWITSAAGQRVIGEFGVRRFGRQLFVPDAHRPEP